MKPLTLRATITVAAAVVALQSVSISFAQSDEGNATERALEQLKEALEREQGLSPDTRRAFRDFADAMQRELARSRVAAPPPAADDTIERVVDRRLDERMAEAEPPWAETLSRLHVYGDVRFREEYSFHRDDASDRNRLRMRVRLRADYQLSDTIMLGAGLRTGDPDDPNSPYVTLGDGFDDFEISLDRALATWRPAGPDGWWLTAGKFANPFRRNPVYGELVWDADVNPEGVVGGFSLPGAGVLDGVDLMAGGYAVLEDSDAKDAYMFATQGVANLTLSDTASATAALAYYLYGDTTPEGVSTLIADNAGNAVIDTDGDPMMLPDEYVSDFGVLDAFVAFTCTEWGVPLTLAGEYIYNTRARGGRDRGWALGAALGQSKKRGDWRFYYQYQVVEQDAVFSAFAQDDFLQQTNFRGHVFGANHQLADNVGLHLWGLVSSRERTSSGLTTDSHKDQWRLRADLTISF